MSAKAPIVRYVAGGAVQAGEGVYVERPADASLLRLCREGAFAYVLTSRQMGKSSLMIRTAEELLREGIKPVIIDLTELGARTTADQWYRGVLEKLAGQLELREPVRGWWDSHQHLSVAQRFNRFLTDVVLQEISERIVVFVDEIDTTLRLGFTDDFFASIRYLYNARATTKALARLSFVLLGVATPGDLIKDSGRTPFNIGQRVDLEDFTEDEAVRDLRADRELVRSVFCYTSGHPYLTLRVFESLAGQPLESDIESRLASLFFGDQAGKDSNLQFVRDMLTKRARDREGVLIRYRDVWRGKQVPDREADTVCAWLRLSGIVRREDGLLQVRNAIYRQVFDDAWIRKNRKLNWAKAAAVTTGLALGVLVLVAAILAPFAYVQRNDAIAAQKKEAQARLDERAQRHAAEGATALAVAAVREAEMQRVSAEEQAARATQAEAAARQFSLLAAARGLTAQSLLVRAQSPNRIGIYFLLNVESFAHAPTLYALQGLLNDLTLIRQMKSGLAHQGPVFSVAFSPDGRLVATGSGDSTARVFESVTGKEVARLTHQGPVTSAVFSPDGRLVATGSRDSTARVFESATWKEVARLAHQGPVASVAFSPDGRLVATGSGDYTARVFESATGKEVARLAHQGPVASVAFSPDGHLLATGSADGMARVFDSAGGKEVAHATFQGPVYSVAFSPDGRLVAAGSGYMYNPARVFESATGKEVARLAHPVRVLSVAFSPDGRLVATGSGDYTARVFESATGKEVARLAHQERVLSVAFSPDGRLVATGSEDQTARVFESATGKEVARLAHQGSVLSVAFSPDGHLVATGSTDGTARVFESVGGKEVVRLAYEGQFLSVAFSPDGRLMATSELLNTPRPMSVLDPRLPLDARSRLLTLMARVFESATGKQVPWVAHQGSVWSVAFSPDGHVVATGSDDNTARVYEGATGKEVARLTHQGPVASVAFSPDGRLVATGSGDYTARVFESATGKEVARLAHQVPVTAVAFNPDGRLVTTSSADSTARVFESATWKEVARLTLPRPGMSVAFSPDGHVVATGSDDNTARVYEGATGKEIAQLALQGPVTSVAFSPNGRLLAAGSRYSTARLFEIVAGKEVPWLAHQGLVTSIAFSPNGRFVAAGSTDYTARVFDSASGKEVARLVYEGTVRSMAFSPDGSLLAVASANKVIVSPWRPRDIIDYICTHLPFNLTQDEWKEYLPGEPYRKTCQNLP